jgi:hypothetical protein
MPKEKCDNDKKGMKQQCHKREGLSLKSSRNHRVPFPMNFVSDVTRLHYLALIGEIESLATLFGKVIDSLSFRSILGSLSIAIGDGDSRLAPTTRHPQPDCTSTETAPERSVDKESRSFSCGLHRSTICRR